MIDADQRSTLETLAGKTLLFERRWVQRTCFIVSMVVPGGLLASQMGLGNFIVVLSLVIVLWFIYLSMAAFDSTLETRGPFSLLRFKGYLMKLIALAYAIAAIKLAFEMFSEDSVSDVRHYPTAAKLSILAAFWAIAVVSYLSGDAQIRAARRSLPYAPAASETGTSNTRAAS